MDKRHDRFIALKYRDFRLLWLGMLVSVIGSQMQIIALNWHVYQLTHSAVALGIIGLVRFFPIIIFSLLGGNVADAHNRKKILLITTISQAVFSGILAYLTFAGSVSPISIYILTALASVAMSFEMPARQAFTPSLIKKEHLANAMSLNMIMWQIAMIVGPMVGGFIIAQLGIGSVYAFNAFSFVAVVFALILIRKTGAIEGVPSPISIHSIKEGLVFVKEKTIIWSTMLLDFFSTFFASATALLPIFADTILHVGPQGLGLLYAANALGAVVAGFTVAHIGTIKRQGVVLLLSIAFYGLATILFGISHWFLLSFFALALVGVGDGISTIIRNTIRQLETPDYIRGRMTSVNMIFFMGGPQLGEFQAGLLASFLTAPVAVAIGGTGTLIVVGIIALTVPVLRRYNNHLTHS